MNDKIEIGEYVRTKKGLIAKFIGWGDKDEDVDDCMLFDDCIYEKWHYGRWAFLKSQITKHSKNLIDLVEEGDFVNGYPVFEIRKIKANHQLIILLYKTANEERWLDIYENNIKTILTHEQYEVNCFKVEG